MKNIYNQISKITTEEPNLMYRSAEEISQIAKTGGLITKFEGEKLIGFGICKSLTSNYVEIGCLYVDPDYRGHGIGTKIFEQALAIADKNKVIVRTKESKLKKFFIKNGFEPVSLKTDWQIALIYLKDRILNPFKFLKFLKTINQNSCLFVKNTKS